MNQETMQLVGLSKFKFVYTMNSINDSICWRSGIQFGVRYLFTHSIKSFFSLPRYTCCGIRSKLLTDGIKAPQYCNWVLYSYIPASLESNCQQNNTLILPHLIRLYFAEVTLASTSKFCSPRNIFSIPFWKLGYKSTNSSSALNENFHLLPKELPQTYCQWRYENARDFLFI